MAAMACTLHTAHALSCFSSTLNNAGGINEASRASPAESWLRAAALPGTSSIGQNTFCSGGPPVSQLFDARPRQILRIHRPLVLASADSFTDEYSRGRTEQKVKIALGPYKDGAIKVSAKKFEVSNDEIEKALKAKLGKTYDFERINFTGSGAKIGHMVKVSFEGKYSDGPNAGQLIRGTKADFFELELQPREDDPWKTFVEQIVKNGMGQEESKSFTLTFPADYKAVPLRNVAARFTVTVHEIGIKKMLEKDPRPEAAIRADIEADLRATAERKTNDLIDQEVRRVLLETSEADVDKVAASVSWAKFGEKSLQDFKWNLLLEEVARNEKIEFEEAKAFLRRQATVNFTP
ncbi:hypothetical protein KFL_001770290 [Klebsormidium nitens]|uniref:Uncharacterized protein n=1 Tax=Klebsormidium nitens TaxID=105231 RepID=A0A1Y1I108_KLENI|nr:hypothetical protein KFL_001770290 [Klebsormidium nitens]|eukprot:GAQ84143.1 hypothetical protein KFL_001770290 [Klebsormidium nitens]